jgi:hypothetical protein
MAMVEAGRIASIDVIRDLAGAEAVWRAWKV